MLIHLPIMESAVLFGLDVSFVKVPLWPCSNDRRLNNQSQLFNSFGKHVPPSNNFKSCNKHVMRRGKSIRCSLSSCCNTKFSEWTNKKEYDSLEGEYPIRSVKELKKLCIDNLYCLLLYCWFVCFFGCFCFWFCFFKNQSSIPLLCSTCKEVDIL